MLPSLISCTTKVVIYTVSNVFFKITYWLIYGVIKYSYIVVCGTLAKGKNIGEFEYGKTLSTYWKTEK